jgi:predicted phosphoribosyltransferase
MSRIPDIQVRFRDRRDAGELLAKRLEPYRKARPVVFAIPRGGVPVGAEVAHGLNAELALGAVTADGERFLNQDIIDHLRVDDAYLSQITKEQGDEARRREQRFRGGRRPADIKGRTVLLVDDGLATGATMRAAARSLRKHEPGRLVVAVPVGSPEACAALREDADEVVCLAQPDPFYAIGLHYERFEQVEDAEVISLLEQPITADS